MYSQGSGGGGGGDRGKGKGKGKPPLPPGITPEMLAAAREMNSGFTPAGKKGRPSKSRGGGGGAGRIAHTSHAPARAASGTYAANSGEYGSRPTLGATSNAFANAVRAADRAGPSLPTPAQPPHLAHPASCPKQSTNNFSNAGHHNANGSSSVASFVGPPQNTSKQSGLPPHLAYQTVQSINNSTMIDPIQRSQLSARQLIVTNMSEHDPTKPFIPAHLKQASAYGAIKEMAEMTALPIEKLTADGVSIPAPRSRQRGISQFTPTEAAPTPIQAAGPGLAPIPVPVDMAKPTGQAAVDPETWFAAAMNSKKTNNNIAAAPAFVPVPASRPTAQAAVDPEAWFAAAIKKTNITAALAKNPGCIAQAQALGTVGQGTDVINVDMVDAGVENDEAFKPIRTLADSYWADPKNNENAKPVPSKLVPKSRERFEHDMGFYPQHLYSVPKHSYDLFDHARSGQPPNNRSKPNDAYNSAPTWTAEDAGSSSGREAGAIYLMKDAPNATSASNARVQSKNGEREKTLKDSRWAF